MIHATDFDELVFTCGELILNDPLRLIAELVLTLEDDIEYAATTSFAVLHAAFDASVEPIIVREVFSAVSRRSNPARVEACHKLLLQLEEAYYAGYMGTYKGKSVFKMPGTLQ